MLKSRRAGLFAAVCSAGLIAATGASAETLADAIALAYQTNPTLQEQRATQRALDENYVQARTGLRPNVDASASVTIADRSGADDSTSSAADLSVTQPLYTGGRVSSQISAAEAGVLAGREGLRSVEQGVLLSVIQAYVDVRRDQERLSIAQENTSVLQRQLDESDARFEVGEITRTDVAQSEARLAAAKAGLSSAQAQLAISRAAYAAIVGQNPTDLEPEPSLAPLLPPDVDQAFDVAEQENPQLLAAVYGEEVSRAQVAAARAQRRPTVGLRGSIGASGGGPTVPGGPSRDYFDGFDRTSLTGSVVASVPIFTGGLVNSEVRQAREQNNADRIAIEGARRDVLQAVSQAWNQLLGARANLVANEQQVKAARIASEGVREEAQVGLRTTLDVLNAEQELRNAELALVGARRDEYVAAALVLQAMGRLKAQAIAPDVPVYDPADNFNRVKHAWGWVPWEPVVEVVDRVGAPPAGPAPEGAPSANGN